MSIDVQRLRDVFLFSDLVYCKPLMLHQKKNTYTKTDFISILSHEGLPTGMHCVTIKTTHTRQKLDCVNHPFLIQKDHLVCIRLFLSQLDDCDNVNISVDESYYTFVVGKKDRAAKLVLNTPQKSDDECPDPKCFEHSNDDVVIPMDKNVLMAVPWLAQDPTVEINIKGPSMIFKNECFLYVVRIKNTKTHTVKLCAKTWNCVLKGLKPEDKFRINFLNSGMVQIKNVLTDDVIITHYIAPIV